MRLTPGETTEAAIVVYDPFEEWNDTDIGLSTWRALYRRMPGERDALRVDQILRGGQPHRPAPHLHQRRRDPAVPAAARRHAPRAPDHQFDRRDRDAGVPQSSFAVGDEGDYAIRTAFKPGETEIVLSYAVAYEGERYEAALIAPRASPEVLLLASRSTWTSKSPPERPPAGSSSAPTRAPGSPRRGGSISLPGKRWE